MRNLYKFMLTIAGSVLASNAFADSVIDEVWKCKANEGVEIEDIQAANSKWVAHVNGALEVGEIKSGTVEPIVGEHEHFYFVDTYPNMAAWSAAKEYFDSEEGQAAMQGIESQFDALFDCTSNELYKYTSN